MRETLTLLRSEEQVKRWILRTDELFRIGRAEDNQARPDARGLSRHHSEIDFKDGRWILRDLGSTNGTWINSEKVPPNSETPLNNGDLVAAGSAEFVYQEWEPRVRVCAVCGDGEIFDEAALVVSPFAREKTLVCLNCCCSLRQMPSGEAYDFLAAPAVFERSRDRLAGGPYTLSELERLGEAVLDELDREHFEKHAEEKGAKGMAHEALAEIQARRGTKDKPPAPKADPSAPPPVPKKAEAPPPRPVAQDSTLQPALEAARGDAARPKRNGLKLVLPGLRIGNTSSATEALGILEEAKRREAAAR